MKTAGKVALVGVGLLAIVAVPTFAMTGFGLFDRAKKLSPEAEKALAKGGPRPTVTRAPDGSLVHVAPDGSIMGPVVGSVGNPRGCYG